MALYQVSYGSFACEFVRLRVDEKNIYDEANISQVGTTYTFNIEGVIAEATIALFQAKIQCANAAFLKPRLAFLVQWRELSTDPWTDLYNINSASDISFGPHPESFNVTQFSGGKAGLYSASVRCDTKDCYSNCTPFGRPSEVLSITRRWSYEVDPNGYTQRSVTGKLLVTAQSVAAGKPADYFRTSVTPNRPGFFQRVSQSFNMSEDGRTLSYTIVDQEVYCNFPATIGSGQASFGYKLSRLNQEVNAILSGHFEAPRATPFQALLFFAYSLVAFYINPKMTGLIPTETTVRQGLFVNSIDFSFTYWGMSSVVFNKNSPDDTAPFNVANGLAIGDIEPQTAQQTAAIPIGAYGGTSSPAPNAITGVSPPPTNSGVFSPSPPLYDSCTASTSPGNIPTIPPSTPSTNNSSPPNTNSTGPTPTQNTKSPGSDGNPAGITQQAWKYPFYEYHQVFRYVGDNGLSVFTPKIANAGPLFQQTRIPTIILLQSGYQKEVAPSAANVLQPPNPSLGDNGTLLSWDVSPTVGEPFGNSNVSLYTTHWNYKIQYNKTIAGKTLSELGIIEYPNSPILSQNNGGTMPAPPNLLPPT
jgi:hypothetical protein